MAVKTFTSGEQLTASDTNTYLANSGLVYITTATATATATLEIDNVFTTTFTRYKLLITGYSNAAGELQYRFNTGGTANATANYWRRGFYYSAGVTSLDSSGTTEHFLMYTSPTSTVLNTAEMECYSPEAAVRTSLQVRAYDHHNARQIMYGGGFVATTQFSGIDIFAAGGAANWSGTVVVYGYRNA